ncbi:DNA polymerase/3'-5' exonuclease PolX [Daejeonella sp.]|uniref:DNA polymerase/3'-5' exonuclease PolX n=1 Tax=Daejeonella sp. TaxID=2805397 RepID=UPI0027186694|nr:DNA polymerase/3'-5' exonuclease PolX [Daejeonella sp.]MDO8991966.1 helix-hairpin-helix domain-containing protein [Daejeonella sp.]MDP2412759.1 helix-hairpin-helix domain-containing protein [Daejeonella sp.]
MENKTIARTLRLLSQLMELHNENPFKVKSVANAAFKVDKLPYPIATKTLDQMEQLDGLGKSIASKIWELVHSNTIGDLSDLLKQTPPGIVEMMKIKGLGPKKILVIWKDLGIESVGELYYACNENRLIEAKGFGLKTQEEIKKTIEFNMASNGRFLYAQVESFAEAILERIKVEIQPDLTCLTGQYRRRSEIIDSIDLLLVKELDNSILQKLESWDLKDLEVIDNQINSQTEQGIKIKLIFVKKAELGWELISQTGNPEHVETLRAMLKGADVSSKSEEEIYELAGLPFIEPELREGNGEFKLAESNSLPELIQYSNLKGSLHNHSTWSDGIHTLEEMALFCKNDLKLEYFGICDHSKSAFYANGLNETRLAAQQREIDELNKKLSPFRIFKGIESDILYDGSLDYSNEVLASFDFVVASVHSILNMNEEKATERLIKAIENPYTTILGHPTGRLLLSRSGYPIDHKKVIDACAENQVIIEINANPLRLDLDWRWHQYAISRGVLLSINPDAHRKEGFNDMKYGTLVARKGGLSKENCLNAMNLDQISILFEQKKKKQQL